MRGSAFRPGRVVGFVLAALSLAVVPAAGQVSAALVAAGFTRPVAFVQDPSDPTVQIVVEQGGRMRVLKSGIIQPADFLDLTDVVLDSGEQGLLGLAFDPDYAANGRLFVYFTRKRPNDPAVGDSVVARFLRSTTSPLRADPLSRKDFVWPDDLPYIEQPFGNHNGGNLAFGPDGYLYVGLGDGGSGNDPGHRAQNPATLLGKMLRLDVSTVLLDDEKGYAIPADNPFAGDDGVLDEIWAFGLRNPWRWSFDDPQRGGTGALIIGDVGQGDWEEVNYEPAGVGGRNYGWRNREGAHDNVLALPPFTGVPPGTLPMTDPMLEYPHTVGFSITGGFVYRGTVLGPEYVGRYFYADLSGRVWSVALTINQGTGMATPSDLREHTATMGFSGKTPSSFGVDAYGELYILSYSRGEVYRLQSQRPILAIETPAPGTSLTGSVTITGHAVHLAAPAGTGVDAVHVWAHPAVGPPQFVGFASYSAHRPLIGALYGARFAPSGWSITTGALAPGVWTFYAHMHSTVTNSYPLFAAVTVQITATGDPVIAIQSAAATGPGEVTLGGYALDLNASSGTGVNNVHVWAHPPTGTPLLAGWAAYGTANSAAAGTYGSQFQNSGWSVTARVPAGPWTFSAHLHSTVTNSYAAHDVVSTSVASFPGPVLTVEWPAPGLVTGGTFGVSGYALDRSAPSGTGVDAVHAWAHRTTGPPVFLGFATYGLVRNDVAGIFGERFRNSGWTLGVTLPPGEWTLAVHLRSTATGTYRLYQLVPLTVQ